MHLTALSRCDGQTLGPAEILAVYPPVVDGDASDRQRAQRRGFLGPGGFAEQAVFVERADDIPGATACGRSLKIDGYPWDQRIEQALVVFN